MSWKHLNDSEPRGRREYVCCLCNRRIRKGAKHVKRCGVYDGSFITNRMHGVCESLSRKWDQGEWETCTGDYPEFVKYELKLPLIGECK